MVVETEFIANGVPLEVVRKNASHDIEKTMSEVTQKHGLEKVLSKAVSENDGIDHMERVHRHGVRETGMNFSGDRWVPKLLADDACPNRKEYLEDEAIDEVLEHDRNDKVEVDVLDVMEDKIEDLEDQTVDNVVVIVDRKQREDVEVVGRSSRGSCGNGYVWNAVCRCGVSD